MRIFGSITELYKLIFRRNSYDITVVPNSSTTFSAARQFNLPDANADTDLIGTAAAIVSVDNTVPRFDGTNGNLLQTSSVAIDDSNNVSGIGNITLSGTVDGVDVSTLGSDFTSHLSDTTTHGTTGNIVGTSDTQALTNKDIDGGTASDTSRITLPKAATATLAGLTRKEGTLVFDSTTKLFAFDNGTNLIYSGGDVVGPASSTDNAICRFDSTTGKLLQNSAMIVDDTGNITGTPSITNSTSTITPLIKAYDANGVKFQENGGTEVGSYTDAGAWSFGGTISAHTHVFQSGGATILELKAPAGGYSNTLKWTTAGTGSAQIIYKHTSGGWDFIQDTTTIAFTTAGGNWTWGPPGGGTHTSRGTLEGVYDSAAGNFYTSRNGTANRWSFGANDNTAFVIYEQSTPGTGGVYISSGATSWTARSDIRCKKNIIDISYGLNSILNLHPVHFLYNTEQDNSILRMGFIAQEVLPIIPQAVSVPSNPEQMMGVSTTELIPVLVKSIQEQQALIVSLQERLSILENK